MNIHFTSAKITLNLCKKFYTLLKYMNFLCSPEKLPVFTILPEYFFWKGTSRILEQPLEDFRSPIVVFMRLPPCYVQAT